MKTRDQAIDDLALSPFYSAAYPTFGSEYHKALTAVFGDDFANGHVLVKARRDLLKAVERAKDYPARAALIEAKRERRDADFFASGQVTWVGGANGTGDLVFVKDEPVRTLDGKDVTK